MSARTVAWAAWGVAVLASAIFGLTNLLVVGPWTTTLALLVVVMAAVMVGLRLLMRRARSVAQAGATVAAGVVMTIWATVHSAAADAMWAWLPTRASVEMTIDALRAAVAKLTVEVPPSQEVALFAPLMLLGFGLVATVVLTVCVVGRKTTLVVLGSLAPWALILAMRWDVSPVGPLAAGVVTGAFAWWAAWVGTPGTRTNRARWRHGVGGVVAIAGAVALGLVAASAAPGLPGWGKARGWMPGGGGNGGGLVHTQGIGVGGVLDVNAALQEGDPTPRLHIEGDYTGPFLLETLTTFDGERWIASSAPASFVTRVPVDWMLWEDVIDAQLYQAPKRSTLTFRSWPSGRVVPLPTAPTKVTNWQTSNTGIVTDPMGVGEYDGLLHADMPPSPGDTINFEVAPLDRGALPGAIMGVYDLGLVDTHWTSHTEELSLLAQQITASPGEPLSDYDKLVAIENYLTSGRFTYTLKPVYGQGSDDVVWDFLQRGTGYCVHFATAMIVLGRLLGIPMRGAVGFAGPASGTGDISDRDAHMWPQAHLQGAGWVDFEPTPGGPAVTRPTNTTTTPGATTSRPPTSPTTSGTTHPSGTTSSSPGHAPASVVVPWQGALIGLAAAAVLLAVALVVRRRYVAAWTPERAWASVAREARRRGLVEAHSTPRAVVRALAPHLPDDAARQLKALADDVEQARYAPSAQTARAERHWYDVRTAVLRGLRTGRHGL